MTRHQHEHPPSGYHGRTRRLSGSLLLVLPVFLIYEIGLIVLRPEAHNAVGGLLKLAFSLVGGPTFFNAAAIVILCVAIVQTRRGGQPRLGDFLGVVAESAIWAVVLMLYAGIFTVLTMDTLRRFVEHLPLDAQAASLAHASEMVVHSAGAGIYEELVFRLVLMTGFIWLFARLLYTPEQRKTPQKLPVLLGVIVSAVLFSLAHHIPPQPGFELVPFVFRLLCGVLFGVLYMSRGLAVAVYTHFIYDVYVMLVLPGLIGGEG